LAELVCPNDVHVGEQFLELVGGIVRRMRWAIGLGANMAFNVAHAIPESFDGKYSPGLKKRVNPRQQLVGKLLAFQELNDVAREDCIEAVGGQLRQRAVQIKLQPFNSFGQV